MAAFINFEAEIDAEQNISDNDELINDNASKSSFINDDVINESRYFYRQFANVENDLEQVLVAARNEALQDIEQFDKISNLNDESEIEMEVDDFKDSEVYLNKFNKTLFPRDTNDLPIWRSRDVENQNQNQFCKVLLLALKFKINGTKNTCDNDEFEQILGKDLFEEINQPEKLKFIIDQQYFLNMCYHINMILAKFGYFLRFYKLKKKYRHLTMKKGDEQQIVRQLSSCLIEKYNGFTVIRIEYDKKERKNFEPLDIIYKPIKKLEIEPLCYFSTDISQAYSA